MPKAKQLAASETVSKLDKSIFESKGRTGLEVFGGYVNEEFHTQLRGTTGVKTYKSMGLDPTVGSTLRLIDTHTRQTPLRVATASDDVRAQDWADFLWECIEDLDHSWDYFLQEVNTTHQYGWSLFETPHKRRSDGKIGWRAFQIRSQDTLSRWEYDGSNNLVGMWQDRVPEMIPLDNCIHFRAGVHKDNPEGVATLRPGFISWYFMKRLRELEAIGAENDATGMPVGTVPPELLDTKSARYDSTLKTTLEKTIASIRRGEREGILWPASEVWNGTQNIKTGWGLELLKSGGSRQFDFDKIITRYRLELAIAIWFAGFLYTGHDKVGSHSLRSSETNTFATALGAWLDTIYDTMNRGPVRRLLDYNGCPPDLRPRLEHGDIEVPDLANLGTFVKAISDAGAFVGDIQTENALRAVASLPERLEDEDFAGPDAEPMPMGDAPAPTEDEQKTALNGAQVTSLLEVVRAFKAGDIERGAATAIIVRAFNVEAGEADAMLGEDPPEKQEPAQPPPMPPQLMQQQPAPPAPLEEGAEDGNQTVDDG